MDLAHRLTPRERLLEAFVPRSMRSVVLRLPRLIRAGPAPTPFGRMSFKRSLRADNRLVRAPIGIHQEGIEGKDSAHDQQVTGHHEHAPRQHSHAVRKRHQHTQRLPLRQQHEHARDQLRGADHGQQKLRGEHGKHKRLCPCFRIPRCHDGRIAPIHRVQVLGS